MQSTEQHTETSSTPCNICGRSKVSVLGDRSRGGDALRSVICAHCGLVWSDPLPHNPRNYYEDDYRVSYKGTYAPKPKHVLRAGNIALSRLDKIKQFLTRPLTVLDVGTGGGEFAYLMQSMGHEISGIEPNKGYAAYSIQEYGLKVQVGFIQDIPLPEAAFDLITIWHVLEHTENPGAVLAKLHTLLKPDGTLVIEVPNIEATCQSPKSTFHEAHIFNFNVTTLGMLAAKAGFTVAGHLLSADGGNITLYAQRRAADSTIRINFHAPGNHDKIVAIVRGNTNLRHYTTAHPYSRFFRRMRQAMQEKRGIVDFVSGRKLLDELYRPVLKQG